ncbi:MAG: D-alanyl-D-alanine carboxypeptidase [Spirochaetales bacterium]|nr:D-alanyl-D-alanine carboxypeptidase [Spirochaetales bacterium]
MKKAGILLCCFLITSHLFSESRGKPELKAACACSVDVESNEIIYAKDIERVMYPASITKLVTAMMLAREKKPEDALSYTTHSRETIPYMLDLSPGTTISAKDAMDALLLFSANDIALMIAENTGGNDERFAGMMNDLASELNLRKTHFTNPNGLHDPDHYTTAYDLSIIGRNLYNYPWILETMAKKESSLGIAPETSIQIKNRNKLVGFEGCTGGKTGWTSEAGRCLLALYERDKRRIIGIILDSVYDYGDTVVFDDMSSLIAYSYKAKKIPILNPGDCVKIIPYSFRIFPWFGPVKTRIVTYRVREPVLCYMHGEPLTVFFKPDYYDPWHLDKHRKAGSLVIAGIELKDEYPVYPDISTHDILREDILPFYAAVIALSCFIVFCVTIVVMLGKKRTV